MADDVLTPGPDVEGEPYWAIMHVDDDGNTDGNLWSFGKRIMLFFDREIADTLMNSVAAKDKDNKYARRGVTEAHLESIQAMVDGSDVELFVVLSLDGGTIEAIPLAEHLDEMPPPLPPPG